MSCVRRCAGWRRRPQQRATLREAAPRARQQAATSSTLQASPICHVVLYHLLLASCTHPAATVTPAYAAIVVDS